MSRRHGIPNNIQVSSPVHEQYRSETEKLHEEIKSLKERLNETERVQIKSVAENAREKDHNDVIEEQHKKYHEEIASLKNALFDEIKVRHIILYSSILWVTCKIFYVKLIFRFYRICDKKIQVLLNRHQTRPTKISRTCFSSKKKTSVV